MNIEDNGYEVAIVQLEFTAEEDCADKNFLINLNLINESTTFVNGRTSPTLKWVSFKSAGRKCITFVTPLYRIVKRGRFKHLHFSFKDIKGKVFTFLEEKTTILLHFKKI